MPSSPEFAIIGGGLLGLGVAWRLAREGAAVRVYERGEPGRGASWAAAGMLAPSAEVEFDEHALLAFALASQRLWPAFAEELEADSGVPVELDTTGTLLLALDRDDEERLRRDHAYRLRCGLPGRWLDGDDVRALEPLVGPHVVSGVLCPSDWNVSNRAVLRALGRACATLGVVVETGVEVKEVRVEAGCVRALVLGSGEVREHGGALLAAGAWSRSVGGLRPLTVPVRPVRGQMMALRPREGEPGIRHVVRAPEAYLVPKRDGRIVLGATSEERGFDPHPSAGGLLTLLRGAWEALPAVWEWDVIDTWVGFRPGSRDNLPLLGATSVEGLFVATGHYRNGIQQAPASILDVTEAIRSGRNPERIQAFAPERFRRAPRT